ncbi:hypothetical protein BGZ94_000262 [Podila epigama]|nr:hypothetical protein BGZ94_000262 [Podila epigama]
MALPSTSSPNSDRLSNLDPIVDDDDDDNSDDGDNKREKLESDKSNSNNAEKRHQTPSQQASPAHSQSGSPSRRFKYLGPSTPQKTVPKSPGKRLRPVSEISKSLVLKPPVPPSPIQEPPYQKRICIDKATTPTKNLSDIAKSLGFNPRADLPNNPTIRPPPPLGPRLQQLAKEMGHVDEIESTLTDPWPAMAQSTSSSTLKPKVDSSPELAESFDDFLQTVSPPASTPSIPKISAMLPPDSQLEAASESLTPRMMSASALSGVDNSIPLPKDIIEGFGKTKPIKEFCHLPLKTGLFSAFVLIISIEPREELVAKSGHEYSKVQLLVCDRSVTSFKIILWRDKCSWINFVHAGDVALLTDLQMKEYAKKVTGNTTRNSKMERLDGSVLARYTGSAIIESMLEVYMEKRRILALDLLDKGLARDPSLYVTQPEGLSMHKFERPGGSGTASFPSKHLSATTITTKQPSVAIEPHYEPASIAILACVVYRMLRVTRDDSKGLEIGVVLPNGRFVKIHVVDAVPWANNITLGRPFKFFGCFISSDNGTIFQIHATTREPQSIPSDSWAKMGKNLEPRSFSSIKLMKEHQFMGDAVIEAYIFGVYFTDPDFQPTEEMFGFIQKYCTACSSLAMTSPKDDSTFFCPYCHLDTTRRESSQLLWMYPPFEMTVGDHPLFRSNLAKELAQVRCPSELGDQLFSSVPADQWMQGEKMFICSRAEWKRLYVLMNLKREETNHFDNQIDNVNADGASETIMEQHPLRIKLYITVGINNIMKATKVEHITQII